MDCFVYAHHDDEQAFFCHHFRRASLYNIKGKEVKLPTSFYARYGVEVAQELLGKRLVFGDHQGIITETEAYRGSDDEASHAYRGITQRNALMFGPPGYTYVYLIYGMYHCLNIVTEQAGQASAVLIRGLKLPHLHLNGPGKLCRYLGITRQENGVSLINNAHFSLREGVDVKNPRASQRIGIRKATDKLWRFTVDVRDLYDFASSLNP